MAPTRCEASRTQNSLPPRLSRRPCESCCGYTPRAPPRQVIVQKRKWLMISMLRAFEHLRYCNHEGSHDSAVWPQAYHNIPRSFQGRLYNTKCTQRCPSDSGKSFLANRLGASCPPTSNAGAESATPKTDMFDRPSSGFGSLDNLCRCPSMLPMRFQRPSKETRRHERPPTHRHSAFSRIAPGHLRCTCCWLHTSLLRWQ
mmetsp:Transcript_115452/g.331365  ORF Transcript_115452/g.331365 Transcript_115452/m.331365 type:complete len:200 (+) Transcript_115452:1299-1898(+)